MRREEGVELGRVTYWDRSEYVSELSLLTFTYHAEEWRTISAFSVIDVRLQKILEGNNYLFQLFYIILDYNRSLAWIRLLPSPVTGT